MAGNSKDHFNRQVGRNRNKGMQASRSMVTPETTPLAPQGKTLSECFRSADRNFWRTLGFGEDISSPASTDRSLDSSDIPTEPQGFSMDPQTLRSIVTDPAEVADRLVSFEEARAILIASSAIQLLSETPEESSSVPVQQSPVTERV